MEQFIEKLREICPDHIDTVLAWIAEAEEEEGIKMEYGENLLEAELWWFVPVDDEGNLLIEEMIIL